MTTRPNEHPHPPEGESRVGELFGRLAAETAALIREDLSLLGRDVSAKLKAMVGLSWLIGGGALVALLGAQLVILGGILRLGFEMPLWLAAGLVGLSLLASGAAAIAVGRRAIAKIDLIPAKAQETLKESVSALGAFLGLAIPIRHRKADLLGDAPHNIAERAEQLAEKVGSRIQEGTQRAAGDLDEGWDTDPAGPSER
jgi:hypothetical protein